MPANRTTPLTPALPTTSSVVQSVSETRAEKHLTAVESNLHQCVSTPDLSTIATPTERNKKRKFVGVDGNAGTIVTMSAFSDFSKKQESRFEDLLAKVNNILDQNIELKKSVEVMSSKYDEFLTRITYLESEQKEDRKYIHQLEDKIEYLERKSRSAGLEIRNVPKINGENKDHLCNLAVNMGKALDVNLKHSDIRDVHRLNAKDKSGSIIIDLNTVILKDKIITGVKSFNRSKDKRDKLNTGHLGLQSPVQPVYVSETLTYKSQRIYYAARQFQKGYGYSFCWTSHGIVYLRKAEKDPQIRINSESDLEKLKSAA